MERRDNIRLPNFSSQSIQESESPIKLPLAPILPTPHDTRASAMASTRRGTSIFSPTGTLGPPPPPLPDATADPDPLPQPIRYKECLKNHAASIGGHVLDGCGEFMPNGAEGTPEAMRCAACDCHRNFHRQQLPHFHRLPFHGGGGMVSFGGGNSGGAESSSDGAAVHPSSKKRFRTKFRQDQKDRMHEFASKLGWRMQKQDEEEVDNFCSEVGVKRQVFKVWMHNNKQAMKKRSSHTS